METIPIFFTVDEDYAPYMDCAIRSLMENASRDYRYQVIVLHDGLSKESMRKLERDVQAPFSIAFFKMEEKYEGLTDRIENRLRCDYFTMTIYFRIFIADLFPQYDKGIYLDSDIVVPGDIAGLYERPLADHLFGACPDYSIQGVPELVQYVEQAVGVKKGTEYVNSGVLLMNLKKLRETAFAKRFLELLNQYHFDCVAPDQDYINAMCYGKILFLDECWDAMPPVDGNAALLEHPKLIHYNLFQKPWCYDNIPYADYFWRYAEQSPFYADICRHKESYSEAQKESDRSCLASLIRRGGEIGAHDVTFRKMYERGARIRI